MKIIKHLVLSLAVSCGLTSCLFDNDLAYPRVPADITAFSVEGEVSSTIDAGKKHINVVLGERADISKVKVEKMEISPTATLETELAGEIDLRDTVRVTLKAWYDYVWTISAVQPIDRHITVDNQIGEAEFDLDRHLAIVYVTESQSLESVTFRDVKLEPEGAEISSTTGYIFDTQTMSEKTVTDVCTFPTPMTLPCVNSRDFMVNFKGEWIIWKIKVMHKPIHLQIAAINPWCHNAEIYAKYDGTGSPVIEYRMKGTEAWTDAGELTKDGFDISVKIASLKESTTYEVRVLNGEESTEIVEFTTEKPEQLPNMSFDEWYQGNPNQSWYPCPQADVPYKIWDTANKGMNMMNSQNPTRPDYDFVAVPGPGKCAVQMKSMYYLKFAAGNIITGNFQRVVVSGGAGAELTWGTPFTSRPQALLGYLAYSPRKIDYASERHKDKLGMMDKLQILFLLTDWDEPFQVKTASETFVDQANDPHIIARGTIESDEDTHGEYIRFRCPLEYRDTMRKPKYVVVIACSSLYGDYFTGGLGSTLWVDEFEFEYD